MAGTVWFANMPKYFFTEDNSVSSISSLVLKGETAHHLLHVLRLKPGAEVTLCDGKCMDYSAVLEETDTKRLTCRFKLSALTPCNTELRTPVTLYQSLPKGDKMEWVVQKAVELGVYKIAPLYSAHSLAKNAEKKIPRYQKIVEAAAGQSMRGIIPEVSQPLSFNQALAGMNALDCVLVACSPSEAPDNALPVRPGEFLRTVSPCAISLWVGPEGGFSPKEIVALIAAGATPISLGQRVLRTETAALAALAQITALLE
jgi:16S rRNA (uracil1498-N3)-methyltransferase